MSNQSAVPAAEALDALGDPTRRQIIEVLGAGPTAVGALADALPVGRPAVSKHLKVLEGAGLVSHTSVGTRNFYVLAPEGLHAVQQWLVAQWDDVLGAFAEHVEEATMTVPPLRRQVLVSCDPATAYRLWVDDIGTWWPVASHSVYGAEARVAFDGDTIVETSTAGETAIWGTITEARPPELLAFSWHPGQSADNASHVSVAFTPTGDDDVTLVTLTHTGWDAYGDLAEAARREYAEGWIGVLDLLAESQPTGGETDLWFVLEATAGPATPDSGVFSSPDFAHHLAFLSSLRAEGVLVAAGSLPDEPGSGMTIIRTRDAATARRVLADAQHRDGSVLAGLLDVRIRPWRVAATG